MKRFNQKLVTLMSVFLIQVSAQFVFAGDGGSSGNLTNGSAVNAIPPKTVTSEIVHRTIEKCMVRHVFKPLFESLFHCDKVSIIKPISNLSRELRTQCETNDSQKIIFNSDGYIYGTSEYYNGEHEVQTPEETLSNRPDWKMTNIEIWDGPNASTFVNKKGLPLVMFEYVSHYDLINSGTKPDGSPILSKSLDLDRSGGITNLHLNTMGKINRNREFISTNESCEGPMCSLSINTKGYVECLQSEFAKP